MECIYKQQLQLFFCENNNDDNDEVFTGRDVQLWFSNWSLEEFRAFVLQHASNNIQLDEDHQSMMLCISNDDDHHALSSSSSSIDKTHIFVVVQFKVWPKPHFYVVFPSQLDTITIHQSHYPRVYDLLEMALLFWTHVNSFVMHFQCNALKIKDKEEVQLDLSAARLPSHYHDLSQQHTNDLSQYTIDLT